MRHCLLCAALLVGVAAVAAAPPDGVKTVQPPAAAPPPEPAPIIKLAVTPGGPQAHALRYALLPDPLDLTPGNAAPLWVRAGDAASDVLRRLGEGPNKVQAPAGTPLSLENKAVPLKDLPRDEIRAYLAHFATALRLADQAARRDHCDWELPPIKIQDFDFPFDDIQHLRTVAALLGTRYMLELSEGRFDDGIHTLQTGFALARDIGTGDTLIQDLVGIAVSAIMFGHVEQWIQAPGSPNLFWALADLPRPLVDVRPAVRMELGTIYRSFPALRRIVLESDKGAMTDEEANRVAAELIKQWQQVEGQDAAEWQVKLGATALVLKLYPDAKKYLLAHGRTAEQVDAMPALQVTLVYLIDQYDEVKDDILKWQNVAPWEARAGLAEADRKIRAVGPTGNPIIALLLPAINKVYDARVRIERMADYLSCAEALRMYAAGHEGKPPEKLDDVKLPLPLDPYTGEGFGKFYKLQADGAAVFEVPPPPNMPPSLGRRFVLGAK